MKWAALWLALLGVAAQHRIDLTVDPWRAVMDAMRAQNLPAARAELEHVAQGAPLAAWERAYAYRWAGQLAARDDAHLAEAERDFLAARECDPTGFDGRMATMHLGEIAMRRHRWYQAERWLQHVENDPDPLIARYAQDRLRSVRDRTRRLTLRYGSIALLALGGLALLVRLVRRLRPSWRARANGVAHPAREFGYALLVTEALAIFAAVQIPVRFTMLAQSGTMACAIPSALVSATLWATRDRSARPWQRAAVVTALLIAMAAGLYLAFDYTWWSVERPLV